MGPPHPGHLSQQSNAISLIDVRYATVVEGDFTYFNIVIENGKQKSAGSLRVRNVNIAPLLVMKRFRSMREFHQKLRKCFRHTSLPFFPPTKWFRNRDPKFVEQRRYDLNYYFDSLLKWANVGQTADLRMRLLREYLTFSDPEIAAHRMFQGMQHGPKELHVTDLRLHLHSAVTSAQLLSEEVASLRCTIHATEQRYSDLLIKSKREYEQRYCGYCGWLAK